MPDTVDKNISFRSLMTGEVGDFVKDEGIQCAATSSAIVATASKLVNLHEEGQALSPEVYFCTDINKLTAVLQGSELISLGQGPLEDSTIVRAIKECAPLATGGWVIFVERSDDHFSYGVMTPTNLPLAITSYEALVENAVADSISIVVRRIAESCVELRGAKGGRRCLYFSDRRADAPASGTALEKFCKSATKSVHADDVDDVRRYLYRTLSTLLVHAHDALFAVLRARRKPPARLRDSLILPAPLSIAARVIEYRQHKDDEALAKLTSATSLIQGMLGSDGVIVFKDNGSIIAYRTFLKLPSTLSSPVAGGARRRTFEALKNHVGGDIEAVFMASQDGLTEFAGTDHE